MLEARRQGGFFARTLCRDAGDSGCLCSAERTIGTRVIDDHDADGVRLGLEVVQQMGKGLGFVAAGDEYGEFTCCLLYTSDAADD